MIDRAKARELGLEKITLKCAVCGEEFESILRDSKIAGITINCGYPNKCQRCEKLAKVVNWFGHHRKEPTFNELKREFEKLGNELGVYQRIGSIPLTAKGAR